MLHDASSPATVDEIFGLKEKELKSTTLLALGDGDEINDWNYKLKKTVKPLRKLTTQIK